MIFLAILATLIMLLAIAVMEMYISSTAELSVRARNSRVAYGCMLVGLIVIWGSYLLWVFSPQRDVESREKACSNNMLAFVMSQNVVRKSLKAPASASFPYFKSPGVEVSGKGECGFSVAAFVDSQNSFGGLVRSYYKVDLDYDPDTKLWTPGRLIIQ